MIAAGVRGHRDRAVAGDIQESDMHDWYEFRADTANILYGYGTSYEADEYTDCLNRGREHGFYTAYRVAEDQALAMRLDRRADTFIIADRLTAFGG